MTVGQWLVAGFVVLVIAGAGLAVHAWWRDKNGNGGQ
jgi:hypothetical protein